MTEAPAPDGSALRLCTFTVGGGEYALDVARVETVLPRVPVTPMPGHRAPFEGVIDVHGAVLPVVDLRRLLGAGTRALRSRPRLLVCLLGRRRLALVVDGVGDVVEVPVSELRPAEEVGPVLAMHGPEDRPLLLLDLQALLRSAQASVA